MPWARASSLHRFLACPAAAHLPRWDDSRGVVRRPYLVDMNLEEMTQEDWRSDALNPALLEIRDKRAADLGRQRHAEKERGELAPEMWKGLDPKGEHELSFSYCCKTGKVRAFQHVNEHARDLWKGLQCEHAVVGTADWVGRIGGLPWVDDLKTGWRVPEVVTPQLLFYAMCWSEVLKHVGPVALSITHQPRGKGTPSREGLWRRVTPMVLEQFRLDLTEAWTMTTMIRQPRPGAHCDYCPSAAWCTAALAA